MRSQLKKIEDLGAAMEEALILDNKYTEHSTVGLAQQWDQLDQLGMRMQHNLEQQIQARYDTCKHTGTAQGHLSRVGSQSVDRFKRTSFLHRNTTGVTEEALKEFSMMFK